MVAAASPAPVQSTPPREVLIAQLANAVALRSAQDQVLWVIIGTFWATNALLLVALFQTGKLPEPTVGVAVGAVGLIVSGFWYGMQRRALRHLIRYEQLAKDLETALAIPGRLSFSAELNRDAYDRWVGRSLFSARALMAWFTSLTFLAWFSWTAMSLFLVFFRTA